MQSVLSLLWFCKSVCLSSMFPLNPPPKTDKDTQYMNLYNPRKRKSVWRCKMRHADKDWLMLQISSDDRCWGSSKVMSPCSFCGWGYFSPSLLPSTEKTLQALSWTSDEVKQKETFMWVFCSNYFSVQNAQNSKRLCSALYVLYLGWTFSGIGLIILCQPLKSRISEQWFSSKR